MFLLNYSKKIFIFLMLVWFPFFSSVFASLPNDFSPRLVGSLPSVGNHVAIKGNYAYTIKWNGDNDSILSVIDVSNPTNPVLVNTIDLIDCGAGKIQLSGNFIYIPAYHNYTGGLQVVDITDPILPVHCAHLPLPEHSLGVAIVGNHTHVADGWTPGNGGLKVVDVSNPCNPVLAGSLSLTDYARGIEAKDNYAYIGDTGGGLKIIDIREPNAPTLVGNIKTDGPVAESPSLLNNHLYMDDGVEIRIINVTNPSFPTLVGNLPVSRAAWPFAARDDNGKDYVYISNNDDGFMVVDVSAPVTPVLVANLDTTGHGQDTNHTIRVVGNYAYVTDGDLIIIQLHNPTVSDISKLGSEDTAIVFTSSDFMNHFSGGNSLVKVEITSLPTDGVLKFSGNNVTVNQEISVENLSNLTFIPLSGWVGNDSFNWNGSDGIMYAENDANVIITIDTSLPVVNDIEKTGYMYTPIAFSVQDFQNSFNATSCNNLSEVQIINLPGDGILKYSGNNTYINQTISVDYLGDLTFVPLANWYGTNYFSWTGSDSGTNHATNIANVTLTIANSCPPK